MRVQRLAVVLAIAGAVLSAPPAAAQWEFEASIGAGTGARFAIPAPFELDGTTFAGPYHVCEFPDRLDCLMAGLDDVTYSRSDQYPWTAVGSIGLRRRLGPSFSLGLGALGGLSQGRQRIGRFPSSEFDPTRPLEPEALLEATRDNVLRDGNQAVGSLAYLHGALRYDRPLGQGRSVYGPNRSGLAFFMEGGGGILPTFLGSKDTAPDGSVPGVHASVGLRRVRDGRDLVFSVTHVRALVGDSPVEDATFAWTIARIGFVFDE